MTDGDRNLMDSTGEHFQGSLAIRPQDVGLHYLNGSYLAVILKVHASDKLENRQSQSYSDRHSHTAVADVLILNDGRSSTYWQISGVTIPSAQPSGLDDYEENLPRPSSSFISGETFNSSLQNIDPNDLDGDWCIVCFIGGNVNSPFITNWWPNPRNKLDTQTSGEGHPDEEGEGRALKQCVAGGRYFRRINGIEYTITEKGDIYLNTNAAGSSIKLGEVPERGRFPRDKVLSGGAMQLAMKSTQPLVLTWDDEEDGIGINDLHDPGLPQTNPQVKIPVKSQPRSNTFIKIQGSLVSMEVPGLFKVNSGNILLDTIADFDIIAGQRLGIRAEDFAEILVQNKLDITAVAGDISITAQNIAIDTTGDLPADGRFDLTSPEVTIAAASFNIIPFDDPGIETQIRLGSSNVEPVVLGDQLLEAITAFQLAFDVWLNTILPAAGPTPAETAALRSALLDMVDSVQDSLSISVSVSAGF